MYGTYNNVLPQSLKTTRSKRLTPIAKECPNQIKQLTHKVKKLEKGFERDETKKQLKDTTLESIKVRTYADPCNRVFYHRYGSDFIIGIAGSKEYALEIQELARAKLKELSLVLNTDQTKIVFLKKERLRFLGYDIYIDTSQEISRVDSKGKPPLLKGSTGGFVRLEAPMQHIVKKLSERCFCDKNGYPTPKRSWSSMPDYQIVDLYNITFGGVLTYYSGACHRHALARLLYIFRYSCAMTLATKHRSSISKIFKQHGKRLEIVYGKCGDRRICFHEPKQFQEKDKVWKTNRELPDPFRTIQRRADKDQRV